MQEPTLADQPVTYYELLQLTSTAGVRQIRLVCNSLSSDLKLESVEKWAAPEDLPWIEKILEQLPKVLEVLSDPKKRRQYNRLVSQMLTATPEDILFRAALSRIRDKCMIFYAQTFGIGSISITDAQNQQFSNDWHPLPSDLLGYIFTWMTAKERGKLAQVSHFTEVVVNQCELQNYCDVVNANVKKFSPLVAGNTLTPTILRSGWVHGDRKLRMLIRFRSNVITETMKKFWEDLKIIIDGMSQNGFLHNPYLRNLVVSVLISQLITKATLEVWDSTRLLKLLGVPPTKLTQLHDPNSIILYAYAFRTVPSLKVQVFDLFNEFITSKLSPAFVKKFGTELIMRHFYNSNKTTLSLNLLMFLYTDADEVLTLLQNAVESGLLGSIIFFFTLSHKLRNWLLSLPPKKCMDHLECIDLNLNHLFLSPSLDEYDDLYVQLRTMSDRDFKYYIEALRLERIDEGAKKTTKTILKLSSEVIAEKITEVESCKFDRWLSIKILKILLCHSSQRLTAKLIFAIFDRRDQFFCAEKQGMIDSYTLFAYLSEAIMAWLLQQAKVLNYLCSPSLTSYKLGNILECLAIINKWDTGGVALLTKGILSFEELCLPNAKKDLLTFSAATKKESFSGIALTQLLSALGLHNFNCCQNLIINEIPLPMLLKQVGNTDSAKLAELVCIIKQAYDNHLEHQLVEIVKNSLTPKNRSGEKRAPKFSLGADQKRRREDPEDAPDTSMSFQTTGSFKVI